MDTEYIHYYYLLFFFELFFLSSLLYFISFFLLLDVVPKTTTDDKKGVDRSSTVIARDNTEGRLNSHFSFKKHLFWFMYVWLLIIINVWVALFFFRITTYYYVLEKKLYGCGIFNWGSSQNKQLIIQIDRLALEQSDTRCIVSW